MTYEANVTCSFHERTRKTAVMDVISSTELGEGAVIKMCMSLCVRGDYRKKKCTGARVSNYFLFWFFSAAALLGFNEV